MYMNYITTTDLRTKSSALISSLKRGQSISLIHRSSIVGKIIPTSQKDTKIINGKQLANKIQRLDLPSLSLKEIDRRYRSAMMKKHGKGLR